jgi:rRNA processing protein Gar1
MEIITFSVFSHGITNVNPFTQKSRQTFLRVFSTNSQLVGRVIDIFGPTIQPFAALKPETKVIDAMLPPGTTLYLKKAPKGGVKKRRKK